MSTHTSSTHTPWSRLDVAERFFLVGHPLLAAGSGLVLGLYGGSPAVYALLYLGVVMTLFAFLHPYGLWRRPEPELTAPPAMVGPLSFWRRVGRMNLDAHQALALLPMVLLVIAELLTLDTQGRVLGILFGVCWIVFTIYVVDLAWKRTLRD